MNSIHILPKIKGREIEQKINLPPALISIGAGLAQAV
jgi:hypothetical protein